MTLDQIKPGGAGVIDQVGGEGALRRRLLDMGLTPGTAVTVRRVAPMGDPMELVLRGYVLTLRLSDASNITMRDTTAAAGGTGHKSASHSPAAHGRRKRWRKQQ